MKQAAHRSTGLHTAPECARERRSKREAQQERGASREVQRREESESERETERDRQRETDRQTDRQRQRETERPLTGTFYSLQHEVSSALVTVLSRRASRCACAEVRSMMTLSLPGQCDRVMLAKVMEDLGRRFVLQNVARVIPSPKRAQP